MHGCHKFLQVEQSEIIAFQDRYPEEVFTSKYSTPEYLDIQDNEEIDYMMDYLAISGRVSSKREAGKLTRFDFIKAILYDNLKSLREEYITESLKDK